MYPYYQGHVSNNISKISYNNSISKGPNQSQFGNSSILQENHSQTLQKEVDQYTRKLEHEKRKLYSIEETYEMTLKEYKQKKDELQNMKQKQNSLEQKQLLTKVKNLEHKTEKMVKQADTAHSENKAIQKQIDKLRKERTKYLNIQKNLSDDIVKTNQNTEEVIKKTQDLQEKQGELKQEITEIALENENEQTQYVQKFGDINEHLLEETKRWKTESSRLNTKKENFDENQNTEMILKRRLKQLINANKEKEKVIHQYKKNLQIIDDAFTTIKQGSGITDIDEITNTFIKSEEQNYSLYTYVDILSQDIDNLEESNKILLRQIKDQKEQNEIRKKMLEGTPLDEQQKQSYKEKINDKQSYIEKIRDSIHKIKPSLEKVLIELSQFGIQQNSESKLFEYKLGFDLNETNLEQYLADLENYINIFLDYRNSQETSLKKVHENLLIDQIPEKGEENKPKQFNVQLEDLQNNKDFVNFITQLKNKQIPEQNLQTSNNERFDHQKLEKQAKEYLNKFQKISHNNNNNHHHNTFAYQSAK
ncbi:hypothetical protein PPERSA_11458 [Pseudocohnilembus persalinus]|uniref:ODAD1 central coiled coil region domain-containing protein n=1 Tax=Pseudocohnilembus persalinus TaxID=266149 RepID=A0A0V0QXJ7_PSEPJ|nr:hypothetical protein PPERSA_11458 [Pseudocohnilembus persalinus]|eukprot:KRX06813.1 hypothetical protein PPERSA_11458 [Pseudocohnilembus persalinus]